MFMEFALNISLCSKLFILSRTGEVTLLLIKVTLVNFDCQTLYFVPSQILLKKEAITFVTMAHSVTVSVSLDLFDISTLKCAHRAPVQGSILRSSLHLEVGWLRLTVRGHWMLTTKGF